MSNNYEESLSNKVNDINHLIKEMINTNYMSDKAYTTLTAMIGHLDDIHSQNKADTNDNNYHAWVKQHLDKICDVLLAVKKHSRTPHHDQHEDMMHPTGDYYNEDKSITLTDETKDALRVILAEEYK